MPRPDCKKRVWSSELLLLILRCHLITMVQPAESRKGLNLALARRANFCCTTCWRVLRESKMRPVLMVIEQVRRHQSFEMPLIQDDHVVQQVSSATSYQRSATPFCHGQPKAVRVGSLPMSLTAESTSAPNFASRSNSKVRQSLSLSRGPSNWTTWTTGLFAVVVGFFKAVRPCESG